MGQKKYPDELRERATRMALEALADPTRAKGAIRRIAREPGASWGSAHLGAPGPGPDQGARPGITRWRGRRADQGV